MNCLIGHSGFVGFNLTQQYGDKINDYYNSTNIEQIKGKHYDTIFCAGVSAKKWQANLDPETDLRNINKLLNCLDHVTTKKFILISTIDVYDKVCNQSNEDYVPGDENHSYGKHRLHVENYVKRFDYLIVRLAGLFGFGLRKNIIYDYIQNGTIPNDSTFQWYYLGDLKQDIEWALNNNIKIINLFTEPIPNNIIFPKIDGTNTKIIRYDIKTKYSQTGYWRTQNDIMCKLRKYIDTMLNNQVVVGNLSWKHNNNQMMLSKLRDFGIRQLEVAPYKYFGIISHYQNKTTTIPIYSMQAILYPTTWNILCKEQHSQLFDYFSKLFKIVEDHGIKILVFGSPKNRLKLNMTFDEALNIAVDFFSKLVNTTNCTICIEPNPIEYGCDFINTSTEGRLIVNKVNSPRFKLHLDVGCMQLQNEDIINGIKTNLDILEHIHFSAPHLKLLSTGSLNYNELFNEITQIYNKKISIEMLNQNDDDIINDIYKLLT